MEFSYNIFLSFFSEYNISCGLRICYCWMSIYLITFTLNWKLNCPFLAKYVGFASEWSTKDLQKKNSNCWPANKVYKRKENQEEFQLQNNSCRKKLYKKCIKIDTSLCVRLLWISNSVNYCLFLKNLISRCL